MAIQKMSDNVRSLQPVKSFDSTPSAAKRFWTSTRNSIKSFGELLKPEQELTFKDKAKLALTFTAVPVLLFVVINAICPPQTNAQKFEAFAKRHSVSENIVATGSGNLYTIEVQGKTYHTYVEDGDSTIARFKRALDESKLNVKYGGDVKCELSPP